MNYSSLNQHYFYGRAFNTTLKSCLIVASGMGHIQGKDVHINRNTFDSFGILYVTKGTLFLEQYAQSFTLTENQGVLISFTAPHRYHLSSDTDSILWVHFNGDTIKPLMHKLELAHKLPFVFEDTTYISHFEDLFQLMHPKNPMDYPSVSQCIYNNLIYLLRDAILELANPTSIPQDWFIRELDIYINTHIYETITLTDLYTVVKMKPHAFMKTFKASFHTTPYQYILQKKLNYSLELLKHSTFSLSEIAHYLGFTDQSHYTNAFRKQFQNSPLQYRKQLL